MLSLRRMGACLNGEFLTAGMPDYFKMDGGD
ncbi:uncharacterized protein METZ01_LOCUS287532 [marine metagenome]|uniref:Uncharacterized protein n=1 Tax=marine metagenome TaxID=408172 RepID=A0A382LCZ0_9ZZZZ